MKSARRTSEIESDQVKTAPILAVCGKGGVGKTTVSALLAKALSERTSERVLLVDGDHAGGLAMALRITPRLTLNDIRMETIDEIRSRSTSKKELARAIDYHLLAALTERGNLAFLPIGRPEQKGCYCSVNHLLKDAIEHLSVRFDRTVIDAEAGIEQINRDVMGSVSHLLLVADTSGKALRVAETIKTVAESLGGRPKQVFLLLNRVLETDEVEALAAKTDLNLIGCIPEDEAVRRFDREERSFLDLPPCPAFDALCDALRAAGLI